MIFFLIKGGENVGFMDKIGLGCKNKGKIDKLSIRVRE